MMLKGSCNVSVKIQSLTQCGMWVPCRIDQKIENNRNVSVKCNTKSQDLKVSVTTKEVNSNNNGATLLATSSLADRLRLGSMSEDGFSFKESYIIRSYEVGMNKTATVETIANLMQEVGCNHAQGVGFSTDGFATTPTMRKLHLIWVAARMHIEIYRYPAWSDVLEIETWCQPEGKIGTRRDFIMKDYANGEVIGRATSKWVMMNMDTRKLERVSPEVAEEYVIFCPKEPRLSFPEPNNKSLRKIRKLADPSLYSRPGLVPRRADLDMNRHVNNVTYIGWLLESMPQEIIDTHELSSITLDYRRECQQNDVVDSLSSPEATNGTDTIAQLNGTNGVPSGTRNEDDCLEFLHLLRLSKDGSEINRGRTEWRRKPQRG